MEKVDDETDEEMGQRELPWRHPGHPGPVQQTLVSLQDDDHGAVAQGHAVHDGQDDAWNIGKPSLNRVQSKG